MTLSLMNSTLQRKNIGRPPVWLMRQAGRYHAHYQALRKVHSFIEVCKNPQVACEATMGPMRDFGFDAAILFSDLLFPLEALGLGLTYPEGPQLDWHLKRVEDLSRLKTGDLQDLRFQGSALKLIRQQLPMDKSLLGFVGGPFTLFCYAVEGSHKGTLVSSKVGLTDGRYEGFLKKLLPLLIENMVLQAMSGADAVMIMDTCAGEIDPYTFRDYCVPVLKSVVDEFRLRCPNTPVMYYSKGTTNAYWNALVEIPFAGIGIDWRHDLPTVLKEWGERWAIQGNVDPGWLFLPPHELERRLKELFGKVAQLPSQYRQGWICGLGHGVLPGTPERNVRLFVDTVKRVFHAEAQ